MKLAKYLVSGAIAVSIFMGGNSVLASPNTHSIVDYLYEYGEDYSFSARKEIATENGIEDYRGTAKQNLFLLERLRGNEEATYDPKEDVVKPKSKTVQAQAQTQAPKKEQQTQPKPKQETKSPQDGQTVLTVEATAYTAYCKGCSGTTATGIDLRANPNQKVIAVDPSVIPLGTKVYVEGYGEAVAGDTGGAIKGNKIDVFIPSKEEMRQWGRKTVKVTILK